MPTINREPNQSIFDIANQHTGGIESAFGICMLNNVSVSFIANESVGLLPKMKVNAIINQDVVNEYAAKKVIPATGFDLLEDAGIGDMAIEIDFIVR